jgi:hypothetical protein
LKIDKANSTNLGWLLIGFAFIMAIGGVVAWAWLPEVQYSRNVSDSAMEDGDPRAESLNGEEQKRSCKGYKIPSRTLEALGVGRWAVDDEKMRVGLRNRARIAWERMRTRG